MKFVEYKQRKTRIKPQLNDKGNKMEILGIRHLSFAYDDRPILQDIDFSVEAGTICGLLGPNASGKTTLFKCMNGILSPQKGQVLVAGRNIAHLSRKVIANLMAVVPQHAASAFSFTALQMVIMAQAARLGLLGRPSPKDYQKAEAALDELGAAHLGHRSFNSLSGGEKQIVLIARGLFQSPSILLLDEPTAHLDFKNQHIIMETIHTIARAKNLTAIITLHDPNLASRYCSRMVMLKHGRVHRNGMAKNVFEADALGSMYGINVAIADNCQGKYAFIPQGARSILH